MIRALSRAEQLASEPEVRKALDALRVSTTGTQRTNIFKAIQAKPIKGMSLAELRAEVQRLEEISALIDRREAALSAIATQQLGLAQGKRGEMGKIVAPIIAELATIEELRSRRRDAYMVEIRWRVIKALAQAGYSNNAIGRYLNRDRGAISYARAEMERLA